MPAVLESVAVGVQLVLALVLSVIAVLAHRRTRAGRFLWLSAALVLFLAQGVLAAVSLFSDRMTPEDALGWGMAANAGAMVALYLGVLRP